MALSDVIEHIDKEIARLRQARELLAGSEEDSPKPARGRPRSSKLANASEADAVTKPKRKLSPEGRKAIAEAMKRRWAKRRSGEAA